MKRTILYEGAKDAQKTISREVDKVEKRIKGSIEEAVEKGGKGRPRLLSRKGAAESSHNREPTAP